MKSKLLIKQGLFALFALTTIIGQAQFATYSSSDVPYSVVADVEYLLPNEIKEYNQLKHDNPDITDEACLFCFNVARSQDNLLQAPATIVDYSFDIIKEENTIPGSSGAVNILVELINSTSKTIKEITLQFEFTDAAGRQLYDMKSGDKYCTLTFNNLSGRTTSTDFYDIAESLMEPYHMLDMANASYRKLFFNSKVQKIYLHSAKITYADGSTSNNVALFISLKANDLLKYGPLSPAMQFTIEESKSLSDNQQQVIRDDDVYVDVNRMPSFPNGDEALMKYISSHIIYPSGINAQGRVVVKFVVRKDGGIGEVKVLKSIDPYLDQEATRVVKSLPKFNPGIKNGQLVDMWYTLPITFRREN